MKKKASPVTWVDWFLMLAITGLVVQLLVMLLPPVIKAWQNRPRPGVQMPQQYLVKQGSDATSVSIPIDYLLYLPPNYSADSKWPLVVYLHGAGSRGQDLELVRREWFPRQIAQGKQFNFILLSPQCPVYSNWSPELLVELIDYISSSFSVDQDRVYLTGVSMGGNGTWATASYKPSRFAAIAPLCGDGDPGQAERLKDIPIWAFHGDKDNVVPLEASQRIVDAVKKCGGTVKFTVYHGAGHGIAEMTYENKELFEWLFTQRRKAFAGIPENCEPHEYRYTGGLYHRQLFPYRLLVPRPLEPNKQYPLLVWLHGRGQAGSDNQRQLAIIDMVSNEKCRFFILAVQCPSTAPDWSSSNIGATIEILQKTMREQPVAPDRIYLSGASSGGTGSWTMAMCYPELFAAIVPMGTGGVDLSRVAMLKGFPIWEFHNTEDPVAPRTNIEETIAVAKQAGCNVHMTIIDRVGHDCWPDALGRYNVMDWMLAQRRGALCWMPPGCHPWQWWHIVTLPCALLAFVRLAWCIEQRRRTPPVASQLEMTDSDFSFGLAEGELIELPTRSPKFLEGAATNIG